MRKILASLFVIAAVVGIGIYATGAYFTDTVSITGQKFVTTSADLKFGQCGAIGDDCSGTLATLDSYVYVSPAQDQVTGPDHPNSGCLVVENTGSYTLSLAASLDVTAYSHPDMTAYFQVAVDAANANCNPVSNLMPWQSASTAEGGGPVAFGSLAPGGRLYLVLYNQWDSTGNQNYLQNGYLTLTTALEGRTN